MPPRDAQTTPRRLALAVVLLLVFIALLMLWTLVCARLLGLRCDQPAELGAAMALGVLVPLPIWMLLSFSLLAPILRVVGLLRYYSPYLIVTGSATQGLALHGASPFDYLLLFRWADRGRPAVRRILRWYIEGLVALARDVQDGRFPKDVEITATSYVISHRAAARFGFRPESSRRFAWGGLLTFPTQLFTYSFSRGQWRVPPLGQAMRARTTGAELCAQLERLERVLARLRGAADRFSSG